MKIRGLFRKNRKDVIRRAPSEFDGTTYLRANPDVLSAGIDPWTHFRNTGWKEYRSGGLNFSPAAVENAVFSRLGATSEPVSRWMSALESGEEWAIGVLRTSEGRSKMSDHEIEVLEAGSNELVLGESSKRDTSTTDTDEQVGSIASKSNDSRSRLNKSDRQLMAEAMDEDFYRNQLSDTNLRHVHAVDHYINIGWLHGLDPSPDFSTSYYLAKNSDIRMAGINPFLHFLKNGSQEKWRRKASSEAGHALLRATEGDIRELINELSLIEPEILLALRDLTATGTLEEPSTQARVSGDIRHLLASQEFEFLIFIPHLRWTGAPRVSRQLACALTDIDSEAKILAIQTEHSDSHLAKDLPCNVQTVDISNYLQSLSRDEQSLVLLDIIRGTRPNFVFNVNSMAFWDALESYGRQISDATSVLSYLFTADVGSDGIKGGYPIQCLNRTVTFHTGILVDNSDLYEQINARFRISETGTLVIKWLSTSLDFEALADQERANLTSIYGQGNSSEGRDARTVRIAENNRVVWSGRLDRQKNFSLLLEIASITPELDFIVFGVQVLNDDDVEWSLPSNVRLLGKYEEPVEVLAHRPFACLHTALWEGTPMGLLDFSYLGIPIVAPTVGGIRDFLTHDTGWPVPPDSGAKAYVEVLRTIRSSPAEAKSRAARMRTTIESRHSPSRYSNDIEQVLNEIREGNSSL